MATVDLLKHARAAIDRATADLDEIRSELTRNSSSMSRQHRLSIEGNARDLERHLSLLRDRFDDMAQADASQLAALWRHFFVAYDDYLETARRAKCTMARDEYIDDLSVMVPIIPSGIRPGNGN